MHARNQAVYQVAFSAQKLDENLAFNETSTGYRPKRAKAVRGTYTMGIFSAFACNQTMAKTDSNHVCEFLLL